jgi:hypothetical protein
MDVQLILVEEGLVGGAGSGRLAILVVHPLAVGKVANCNIDEDVARARVKVRNSSSESRFHPGRAG